MEQEQIIQKEKETLTQDILKILRSLNTKFPKLIGDVILTIQEDMQDSSLVQQILNNMKTEVSEKNKIHMSHECMPQNDAHILHIGLGLDSFAGVDIWKELARPEFTLNEDISECLPCGDVPDLPIAIGFLGESSKKHADFFRTKQAIKNDIQQLTAHKIYMGKNLNAFREELELVNLILGFLEGHCV